MSAKYNTEAYILLLILGALQHTSFGLDCFVSDFGNYNESTKDCSDVHRLTFINISAPWSRIPAKLIEQTQRIQGIIVDGQSLKSIDNKGFCEWKYLTSFSADANQIKTLPSRMLGDCHNLQMLSLSNNSVNDIFEDTFYGLSLLVELDLSNNQIVSLPDVVFHPLISLRVLLLTNNKIGVIDKDHFTHNSVLNVLELNYNQINFIEQSAFWKLERLQTLELSFNPELKVIDLTSMDRLHDVYINNCNLSNLHIPNMLEEINANSNKITRLSIDSNSLLSGLYLKNNSFQDISELTQATKLRTLDISNNNITTIDFSYLMGTQIRELFVLDNPIQNFNVNSLTSINTIKLIEISLNNLDDQTLADLMKETRDKHISVQDPNRVPRKYTTPLPIVTTSTNGLTTPTNGITTQTNGLLTTPTNGLTTPSSVGPVQIPTIPTTPNVPVPSPVDTIDSLLDRIKKLESLTTILIWVLVAFSIFISCQVVLFVVTNYRRCSIPIPNIFSHNGISNGQRDHIMTNSMDPILEDTLITQFKSIIGVVQLVLVMSHAVTGQSYTISNLGKSNEGCKKITFDEITQDIPSELSNENVCSVEVRNQQLDIMTVKRFCGWKNLTYIYAEMDNITSLPANFLADCHNLQTLSLSGNKINTIDENAFQNLSALTTLDLSNNNIDVFNGSVCKPLQSLTNLRLNNNKLKTLNADIFQNLTKLVKLDLSNNSINQIDNNTFNPLQELRVLNVSFNPDLKYMKYTEMPKLKVLNIAHDQFTDLYVTSNMTKIIAEFNKISSLSIDPTNKLERIYLRNNSLLHIEWIWQTPSLKVLDAPHNNISFNFQSMFVFFSRKIESYDLTGNPCNFQLDKLAEHDEIMATYITHKVTRLENDISNLINLTEKVSDLKAMTYWMIIIFTLFMVFQISLFVYKNRMHSNVSFPNVFGQSNRPTNRSDEFNEFYPNLLEHGF
ncbi:protein artichoke-like [Contarinia nasturtii]|uniref:protein artichoke-like n=1 Tax=Contarinia nasturtii TaxID=265458 RepID=UPI0012D3F1DA|nr:protein artichoke-like [Contarinia nasturtii]